MGSNGSKANNEPLKPEVNCNSSDPRSPTPEIVRTPLQGKPGGKHNITKNCDLRKTFDTANAEEKLIHNNPILSAVIKNHLQSYDPRSPTQDFERTPVIIASKIDEINDGKKNVRQYNDSCASPQLQPIDDYETFDTCTEAKEFFPDLVPKNLCAGFYDMSLNGTIKETEEPLGSSTASNEVIQENISPVSEVNKPTKLLETNFEYVENEENFEDSCEDIENADNSIKVDDQLRNVAVFTIIENDPRSPSIGIERTPIVITNIQGDSTEGNVEEMSDDSLIKVLQSTNAELRQTSTKMHDKNSDELLVYEDETTNINDTPKKSKSNSNSGSRTPLSCMKNKDSAHIRSKSANMLYDPKNQKQAISKIPKRVSHIPRLKSLSKQTQLVPTGSSVSLKNISKASSISGDCENTPPNSHRDKWDKESSIVL